MSEPKAALRAGRESGFAIRPNDETTIVRVITDPAHPEYDPRAELPVDENLVDSLIRLGQLQQAVAYKDGMEDGKDVVVLVDGRQRWKAMQEVWNRFEKDGTNMKLAPSFRVVLRAQKNAAQRREIRISANRHRQELSGLALAQELRNHLDIVGDSEEMLEEARVIFNFRSLDALRNCLALLETTPAVQEHLAAGTLSPTGALQLSRQAPEVQDAVAGRIAAQSENEDEEGAAGGDGDDDESGDEAGSEVAHAEPKEKSSKPRTVPVSEVKEMIRDATGQKSFDMVSVKQVEKEIDKKEKQREAALKRLEEMPTNYSGEATAKHLEAACRVAGLTEYIAALRWARGETVVTDAGGATNDKASGAWEALREAIIGASWPTLLTLDDLGRTPSQWEQGISDEERLSRQALGKERSDAIAASHLLVVAGEPVAYRSARCGRIIEIRIDTASKWFTRLMDPFGNPHQLVRDFGAHGWLRGANKIGDTKIWKSTHAPLTKTKTVIWIDESQLEKWIRGTAFEAAETVDLLVRRIVASNTGKRSVDIFPENRFGAPWFGLDPDDPAVGPDLMEDRGAREGIRDDLDMKLDIDVPGDDCTWATVGDLISYVERRLSTRNAALDCQDDLPPASADDETADEDGKGGEE